LAPDQQLRQTWAEIQRRLRAACPDSVYQIWLARLEPAAISGGNLYLKTPAESRDWVRRRFGPSIERAAREVDPRVERIEFVEPGEKVGAAEAQPRSPARGDALGGFKPTYTFDRFVIGESNRFAHAAALAVAEVPGQPYNPLFVHGPSGVGKTHLLQAIGNYTAFHDTRLSVHYVTVEAFTNEFTGALQRNDLTAFKSRYRKADLLLVDDVQSLEGKQKTAEEFFHTIDSLLAGGAQVVLSSDRYPAEIPGLDTRLRERFQSGLVVDVQAPDFETRLAILRKLASSNPSAVPPQVLEHVAEKVSSNVRVLEGAFVRVVAFASLVEQEVTVELADRVLSHLYERKALPRAPERGGTSIACIQQATAALFDVGTAALCSSSRRREVVYARQVAMYLCRELTTRSLPTIGREFGGRDHTTVLYAHRKITREVLLDASTRSLISKLTKTIHGVSQPHPHPVQHETPSN
jgi:chromosomal replication initiator protein